MSPFSFRPDSPRIALARRRLAAAYSRQPGAEVPVVEPLAQVRRHPFKERFEDLGKMLDHAVNWANSMAAFDNDWPPCIDTFCTVVMVAEAFGCQIMNPGRGEGPWAGPAIEDMSKVWSLKPKPMAEVPMIRRTLEWIDLAQRELGTEVPFWTMDVQSPFSVAAQIIHPNELFVACLTRPREVHHLCRIITEFTIEMMRMFLSRMEHPGFPGRNFPSISDNVGICLSDDTPLIMLGPDLYRQFALPYNSQVSRALGGLHIHCCGDYRHNLLNVLAIDGVRSMQLHAGDGEFKLPDAASDACPFNVARKKLAYFVDANDITRGDEFRGRPKDHYEAYVLPRLLAGDLTGCILESCGAGQDLPDAAAAVRWTRERLQDLGSYVPQAPHPPRARRGAATSPGQHKEESHKMLDVSDPFG